MTLDIDAEVAALEQTTTGDLQERYAELFQEETRSRHRRYLIRKIAWRMQELAEGGLSERARRRAEELAIDADVRTTAPKDMVSLDGPEHVAPIELRDSRLPEPGTSITRHYKGTTYEVRIVADGFEYNGERFRSLSAVARAITGSHINGFRFFKLQG